MTLEVAEHIPADFEEIFLDNVIRHARSGIILSWAVPGQGGYHHVNLRSNDYVIAKMDSLCFAHDLTNSTRLRQLATFGWFKNNVNVFHRKQTLRCGFNELDV